MILTFGSFPTADATTTFFDIFCTALALPRVMLGSIARTPDPRVGGCARDAGAAAAVMPPADPAARDDIIRGCIQVVLWGWVPDGEVLGGAGDDGVGDPGLAEHLVRQLAARLNEEGAQEGAGSVRRVSVQVGQARASLGGPGADMRPPGGTPLHNVISGGSSSASVRLLQMCPPAAPAVTAAGGSAPLAVRLLLHSPTPQPARVLVLAERPGAASSSAEPSGAPLGGGLAPVQPTRARLLLELPVQLVGGVQEVQLALGPRELAEAVRAADGAESDAVGVLRVMMIGPEHDPAWVDGQLESAACAPYLVHWVAPPLLLLPPAAAAEVCDVWGAMQREAAAGTAETQEQRMGLEQVQQQQQQPSGEDEQAEAGGGSAPLTWASNPYGSSELLDDRAEWRSALWWSHMVPLLVDLAAVLGGQGVGQGGGEESGEEGVDVVRQEGDEGGEYPAWEALAAYLWDNGMAQTLSLLSRRSQQARASQHEHQVCVSQDTATSFAAAAAAAAAAEPGLGPPTLSASQPSGPMPAPCCSNQGRASPQQPPTFTGAYPAGPYTNSTPPAHPSFPCHVPSPHPPWSPSTSSGGWHG